MYNTTFFAILNSVILIVDMSLEARFVTVSMLIILGTAITVFSLLSQKALFISQRVSVNAAKTMTGVTKIHKSSSEKGKSSKNPSSSEMQMMYRKLEDKEEMLELLRKELKKTKQKAAKYQKKLGISSVESSSSVTQSSDFSGSLKKINVEAVEV